MPSMLEACPVQPPTRGDELVRLDGLALGRDGRQHLGNLNLTRALQHLRQLYPGRQRGALLRNAVVHAPARAHAALMAWAEYAISMVNLHLQRSAHRMEAWCAASSTITGVLGILTFWPRENNSHPLPQYKGHIYTIEASGMWAVRAAFNIMMPQQAPGLCGDFT